jgi:8-oxo-dGTP diphosphatase
MALFLVRHAKAGKRSEWFNDPANRGDDRPRPLDAKGRLQANAIADRLLSLQPTSLHSSPYERCIQTLAPLGQQSGLVIIEDERLAENNDFEPMLALLESCADGSVLCSHGDMIPMVTDALERRGMVVTGMRDSRKASIWVLERDGDIFARGHAWPPPSID